MTETTIIKEGDREVGRYNPDKKQFVSVRDRSKHFFYKGAGYPISVKVLEQLQELGCEIICIIEKDGDKSRKLKAHIKNYLNAPVFHEQGFEEQRCLQLVHMVEDVEEEELPKIVILDFVGRRRMLIECLVARAELLQYKDSIDMRMIRKMVEEILKR